MSKDIILARITTKLNLSNRSVKNTIELLEDGSTIPFISRYRKEATGSLDEVDIGKIARAWKDINELVKRKEFVLETIKEQGHLSSKLQQEINNCWDSSALEDIYLPYKKKRKTRATVAKENGLERLAQAIWNQSAKHLEDVAQQFINNKVPDVDTALQGARDIIAEWINEEPKARDDIRRIFDRSAMITSKVVA